MKTLALMKILGAAAVLSGIVISTASADNTGHDTQMACYASVHTECYGDGADNCTEEVYNEGLDECDAGYGDDAAQRGAAPTALKTDTVRPPYPFAKKTR